jgi:hypothetical protein
MTIPVINLPRLTNTTLTPQDFNTFVSYFTRLYEDIAFSVNFRDFNFFPMPITSTAQNILLMPNFGSFVICVSGITSSLPTLTAALNKASSTAAGSIAVLGSQAGTDAWAGFNLTISSTTTNFQIAHNNAGITGQFNLRIIGTQSAV